MMPVDFLSDEQVGAYGRFVGVVSELDLARFFFLDDDDLTIVGRRRGAANRLGLAVQLGTVRYLGRFLDDPMASRLDALVDSALDGRVSGLEELRKAPV